LAKTVAVSFEEDSVKIVHAFLRGNTLSVDSTSVISDTEFENYLQKEKATDFIVTCEFKESYHDLLTVPNLKPAYLKRVIESEIKKNVRAKELSFVYNPLGEQVVDNKKVLEVFYYAVQTEEIQKLADRFYRKGKVIKAIYPSVYSAATFIASEASGEANLGIIGAGKARLAFFTKADGIHFIRDYESLEPELSDFDVQNINMTISYCLQTIRVNAAAVFLMGSLSQSGTISALPSAPIASLCKPERIRCQRKEFNDFMLPMASYYVAKSANILSQDYKNINLAKTYMAYASKVFLALAVIFLALLVFEFQSIAGKKEEMSRFRKDVEITEKIYNSYLEKEEQMRQYRPVVDLLNRPAPEIQELMMILGEESNRAMKFRSLEIQSKDKQSYAITIHGDSLPGSFSSMQAALKNLTDSLSARENFDIEDSFLDMTSGTFKIDMLFKSLE